MSKYILILGIIISLLVRGFFIFYGKHVADIWHLDRMANAILQGQNPYLVLDFNVYPPGALFLQTISLRLHNFFPPLEFHMIIKFWTNLADFITAFVIYKYLIRVKVKPMQASLWSVFFLLNPISIIISSAHGQLDSITSLFVLLSIFTLTLYSTKFSAYLSALLLGLAVAIKPNPIILLPLFLLFKRANLNLINYLLLALAPILISLIPYLSPDPQHVLVKLLTYSGVSDFSYAAVLRGLWYQINAATSLPITQELLNASKLAFPIGCIWLILLFASWKHLAKASLAIYLLFLGFHSGISAQYLTWVIPLAIIEREKMLIFYILSGTIALVGFYLFFGPDLLFGRLWTELPFQRNYMYPYFWGNLIFWIVNLIWLIKIVLTYTKTLPLTFNPVRRKLILFSFLLFIVSISYMLSSILQLIDLYIQDS